MADTLTQADLDAIATFKEEQAHAAHEARTADRTLEDIYLDEFHAIIEGDKPGMHIMEALATLAAFFHDDDPEFILPGSSEPNNAQFQQKGLLNQLCQQADYMQQGQERFSHVLRKRAVSARSAHGGGEIDTQELEEAELNYGRAKIVQMPILADFKKAAMTAFTAQFGEEWTRPVKRNTAATTEKLEDRFAHSQRRRRL